MPTKKNYYVCLRFKGKPKLHMTLRYLANLCPVQMVEVIDDINQIMNNKIVSPHPFHVRFSIEAWYGPQHTVRVLEPNDDWVWPNWMLLLMSGLPTGSQKYGWHPHVACEFQALNIEVIAVSLMCKKVEVARWDLT